ncbi:phosphoribosyltransferase [Nafulsella turpanensis]|uniref:phosphoribosyltransferase n=1 Tax=Nafulsella turpanensis TaxID=1265690 RepID=UPI001F4157E6|nr:phosphoribosyltransferase family protein [Nafulsella turpanensis]
MKNREEAGQKLSEKLLKYKGEEGIVMAVPRGGVPVGYEISRQLDWPLDIVMVKKIGHPTNKEFAIGAVSFNGQVINHEAGVPSDYIDTEVARVRNELNNQYHKYMDDKEPLTITGKTVILTDDGVATGQTLLATVELLKKDKPAKIIVAVPASSPDAMQKIEEQVEEAICLTCPQEFNSVGEFYQDFEQVTDEEVLNKLHDRRYHEEP